MQDCAGPLALFNGFISHTYFGKIDVRYIYMHVEVQVLYDTISQKMSRDLHYAVYVVYLSRTS